MMIEIRCRSCGGQIGMKIIVDNIFGQIHTKVMATKIEIGFKGLYARDVSINAQEFMCFDCRKIVTEDNLQLRCRRTGFRGGINDFFLCKLKGKNLRGNNVYVVHEQEIEQFEKDAKKDGSELIKRRAKIVIKKDVQNVQNQ